METSDPQSSADSVNDGEIATDHQETVALEHRATLQVGKVFAGRYMIEKKLGQGGFGIVYRAFDRSPLQRLVALKVILIEKFTAPKRRELAKQQFLEEAKLAGRLSHANIAKVLDVGESSGHVYMTQELAPGSNLRTLMQKSGPLPLKRILTITRQVCDGLADAHSHAIIHRDIKPSNIVVDHEDRVKITDFGIAQPPQSEDSTLNGAVAGTPGYMAPEQLHGDRVDARADIFAVGCVLYHLLANRAPFEGATFASVSDKTLHTSPPGPSRVRDDLPRALDRIVARAMRKNVSERYPDISLLAQELLNYEQFDYLIDPERGAETVAASLIKRKCVLFLGLRLPTASDGGGAAPTVEARIVDHLGKALSTPAQHTQLSRVAQDLEMERGRTELLRHLAAAVRNPAISPREIFRRVARLPFPLLVTTGYDMSLEEELDKSGRRVRRILDCKQVPDDPTGGDLLVRLFGCVTDEDTVIVTEDDLWDFFGTFHALSDTLKSFFATCSILFVGYDPEDEGFRHLVSELFRFRSGRTEECYLPATDASLPAVRWAERKGLKLIDAEPESFLTLLEETIVERRRREKISEDVVPRTRLPSRPYKFLNFYEEDDENIFFGRSAEIRKLLSKIHAYPLNLLYAPSGSGKTSLINAGLVPQLRRDNYCPIYARVYDDPAGEIRRAVLAETGHLTEAIDPESSLTEFLQQQAASAGKPLVIFIDQFEEIFIRFNPEVRDQFAAELESCLASAQGSVRFVLALREDFLARLSEFRHRLPTIFHNEFRLGPLDETASRTAIEDPAKLLGIEVESALIDRLIADLSIEGIDPPQLQIVCDTLFDALSPGDKRMTLKSYISLGETRKILAGYLERVLHQLPPAEREPTREILKNLVTSEETKTVCRAADLVRAVGSSEEEVLRILAELSNRRLIRRVQHEEGFWYELTHEYLVEEISRWLSDRDRELKRIRELLEQAVRNHRQLGLFMPRGQIRLVRSHGDDLKLSKEERQLLRASGHALRRKRKLTAAAAVLAALLVLCAGVGWRYTYLDSHVVIQSKDRELISYNGGSRETRHFEDIHLFAGSPVQRWIDTHLGFPKPIHQTDFQLQELAPDRRDALKGGLMFKRDVSIESQLLSKLSPVAKARFLFTTGRNADLMTMLSGVYSNKAVDDKDLDELTCFLGASGIQLGSFVEDAVGHASRRRGSSSFVAFKTRALVNVLAALPNGKRRDYLKQLLEMRRTRKNALTIFSGIAKPSDAGIIIPYLEDEDRLVQFLAIAVLAQLGDCSELTKVRELLDGTEIRDFLALQGTCIYLSLCGDESDLTRLEKEAPHSASLPGGLRPFIGAAYQLAGQSSFPTIRRLLGLRAAEREDIQALRGILDPDVVPELRVSLSQPLSSVRAEAALGLAERGDTAGLSAAAAIARDDGEEARTRATAVETLGWFQGPGIRRFLLQLLTSTGPKDVEVRIHVYRALRWYQDRDALLALVKGLEDRDHRARLAARRSLAFLGSERAAEMLRGVLESSNPVTKVYAARALQDLEDEDYSDVFRRFLEIDADAPTDYEAIVQAIHGLRNCYLDLPVPVAVEGLGHPRHDVRLAATLSLVEHQDRSEVVKLLGQPSRHSIPRRIRTAMLRTEWALGVVQRAETDVNAAHESLANGDALGASRIVERIMDDQTGYRAVLGMGLAYRFKREHGDHAHYAPAVSPERSLAGFLLPEISLSVRLPSLVLGMPVAQLNTMVLQHPGLREEIRENPGFEELHTFYAFRVLSGIQPPKLVEDLEFPEVPSP